MPQQQLTWKGQILAEEDDFLDALVSAMDAGGAGAAELLELAKDSRPEWYQLGLSAMSLRHAFTSPADRIEGAPAAQTPPTPNIGRRTRAIAAWVAILATLATVAVIGYGYRNVQPPAQPQPIELTLTPAQLETIAASVSAKLPRGTELANLTTLADQQGKLIADLRGELSRANLAREAADKAVGQLRDQTTELRETIRRTTDQLTTLKTEHSTALEAEREKHSKLIEQSRAEAKLATDARDLAEKSLLKVQKELETATAQAALYAPIAKAFNDKQNWVLGKGPLLGIDWIYVPMPEMTSEKHQTFCLRVSNVLYKEFKQFQVELKGDKLELKPVDPK